MDAKHTGPFTRLLTSDAPRRKWYQRPKHERSVLHWGQVLLDNNLLPHLDAPQICLKTWVVVVAQRKLLLSEIEFLTMYAEPEDTMVYAGAAPGNHTEYLSSLFPLVNMVLVDPNKFQCAETDRITVRQVTLGWSCKVGCTHRATWPLPKLVPPAKRYHITPNITSHRTGTMEYVMLCLWLCVLAGIVHR